MNYQGYLDAFQALATEEPEVLQAVCEQVVDEYRDALLLQFPRKALIFTVNPDDDSLQVELGNGFPSGLSAWAPTDHDEPWRELLGRSFGWGWITVNQQGYCDGALLSFDGITPTVLLNVRASSLILGRIVTATKLATTRS